MVLMAMQIRITGGFRFGSCHLAGRFHAAGHDVTVLDSMHPYYDLQGTHDRTPPRSSEQTGAKYEFVEGDIRNATLVTDLVEVANFVYHQAA
jgi:UDP-glucose 4-epimerase